MRGIVCLFVCFIFQNEHSLVPLYCLCYYICLPFSCIFSRTARQRVLKWAWLFFVLSLGSNTGLYADWLARRQYVINVIWRRTKCWRVNCVLCLTNLALWTVFVSTLISRTNAYAGCGRPTLNFIEGVLNWGAPFRQWSHFTSCQSGAPYVQIMSTSLAWMWT